MTVPLSWGWLWLIHSLLAQAIGFLVRVCSPILACVQRENGFSVLLCILFACAPFYFGLIVTTLLLCTWGFSWGLMANAIPTAFMCYIIYLRRLQMGQDGAPGVLYMGSSAWRVNVNTFSLYLKGSYCFEVQRGSFATLLASFEGWAADIKLCCCRWLFP